jgi:glyoxylase-like metal-dependent hydrolase (beta-lactamase superfamily II)
VRITVGPLEENSYFVRAKPKARCAVLVDPGDEPERLIDAARTLDVNVEAILITHCHFDHVGAVAAVAAETGAVVYCPSAERAMLAAIMNSVPPGFGPFESFETEHTVQGGERLAIAGLDIEVILTPGHSPGHVTYAIAPDSEVKTTAVTSSDTPRAGTPALFAGDVILKGAVGRVDLPGGSWPLLKSSIGTLLRTFPLETVIYPGHDGPTTLGDERAGSSLIARLATDADTTR